MYVAQILSIDSHDLGAASGELLTTGGFVIGG
jgi:hypothetical protein